MTPRANYPDCPEPQYADRVERQIVTLSAGHRQVCTQAMTDLGLLCGRAGHRTTGDSRRTSFAMGAVSFQRFDTCAGRLPV